MATVENKGNRSITKTTRTFRFDGYVPRDGTPYIVVYRETIHTDEQGDTIGLPVMTSYALNWDDIAGKSWTTAEGKTIKASDIYEVLALVFDEHAVSI